MISIASESKKLLHGKVDEFGDKASEMLTPETLRNIFDNMTNIFASVKSTGGPAMNVDDPEIIKDIVDVADKRYVVLCLLLSAMVSNLRARYPTYTTCSWETLVQELEENERAGLLEVLR